ncbi:MAG: MerR family transcriptional regulator [Candidatus Omnitrophica bacterium]|nr:MerR family transcriptional regulator [Candidatus Omnitrophota bacterium]
MDKREILEKNLTYQSKDPEKIWGQEDLNISDTIEFLQSLGFEDVTHKMLRDSDGIINPLKKDSGYRSFNIEKLSKAKIVLMLKAVDFSNKKITHLFELRSEIIDMIEIVRELKDGKVSMEDLGRKVDQYRLILNEVYRRIENMKKVIDIGMNFFNDEDERARNLLNFKTINSLREAQFGLKGGREREAQIKPGVYKDIN